MFHAATVRPKRLQPGLLYNTSLIPVETRSSVKIQHLIDGRQNLYKSPLTSTVLILISAHALISAHPPFWYPYNPSRIQKRSYFP